MAAATLDETADNPQLRLSLAIFVPVIGISIMNVSTSAVEAIRTAAGVSSAVGNFGLSFGLACVGAMMFTALSFSLPIAPKTALCSRRQSSSSPTRWRTTLR
jgi:hypothetical protein